MVYRVGCTQGHEHNSTPESLIILLHDCGNDLKARLRFQIRRRPKRPCYSQNNEMLRRVLHPNIPRLNPA